MALQRAVGSFTFPETGSTVSITGLSFQPSVILLFSVGYNLENQRINQNASHFSWGAFDGTNNICICGTSQPNAATSNASRGFYNDRCLAHTKPDADGLYQNLAGASLNSDGATFTINDHPGAGYAHSVYFVAIGGVDAEVGTATHKTVSTGTKQFDLDNTSLKADLLLFGAMATANATINGLLNNQSFNFGVATGTTEHSQYCQSFNSGDNLSTTNCARSQEFGKVQDFVNTDGTGMLTSNGPVASVSDISAGSFTLDYSLVPTSVATPFFYVAISGIEAEIFRHEQPSTDATSTELHSFTPELALFSSWLGGRTGYGAHSRFGFGAYDGTNERAVCIGCEDNQSTSDCWRLLYNNYSVVIAFDNEWNGVAKCTFDHSKTNLAWTLTDTYERGVLGVVIRERPDTANTRVGIAVGQYVEPVGATSEFKISGFGTPQAAIFFGSEAGPWDQLNKTNYNRFGVGFFDGTSQYLASYSTFGAVSTTDTNCALANDGAAGLFNAYSSGWTTKSDAAWITDGVKLTVDEEGTGAFRYGTALLLKNLVNVKAGKIQLGADTSAKSVTDLGFKPDLVFFSNVGVPTENLDYETSCFSFGVAHNSSADVLTQRSVDYASRNNVGDSSVWNEQDNGSVAAQSSATDLVRSYEVVASSFVDGGFTLTPSAAPGSDTIYYLALELADPDEVSLSTITTPTTAGTEPYTGIGFQPEALMLFGLGTTTESEGFTTQRMCFGFADARGENSYFLLDRSGQATTIVRNELDNAVLHLNTNSDLDFLRAQLDSLDEDGFTLNYSQVYTSARNMFALAFKATSAPVLSDPTVATFDTTTATIHCDVDFL